jgi:anaerobic selenocysteine-containing dehydrogenase
VITVPGKNSPSPSISKTICSICNPVSHCGIDAHVEGGRVVKVEGSLENPHSAGTLCAKGAANRQYIYHPDRLLKPLLRTGRRGEGRFETISWQRALDLIGERLGAIKEETGPESVFFYVGYPKWMRPFVQRLTHSFGSPNFGTESSCCATAVKTASFLNYGAAPLADIRHASCLLVWSSNPFYSNSSTVRRLLEARERGLKIIEVGPLHTPLSKHADIHLRMRPGTSGALALGMAQVIIAEGLHDQEFISQWSHGFAEFEEYVKKFSPQKTQQITGVPADKLIVAARLYAASKPAAQLSGMSPTTHHTNGVQNQRAISLLIGLTGNFDVQGGNYALPPSYLNQPAGFTSRENDFSLAASLAELPPRVGQKEHPVWCKLIPQAQAMALAGQIESGEPYPIRALLGFGFNHRMWPGPSRLAGSLKKLDFIVNVELFKTESCDMCDLVLPACTSFERSELKVYPYPSRYAVLTQPVIPPLGQSRSDADIVSELAKRITPHDELLCAGHEAWLSWMLEGSGLDLDELAKHPGGMELDFITYPPYRKYLKKGFNTPSGKMEFSSGLLKKHGLPGLPVYAEPWQSPVASPELFEGYPLILTTGARKPGLVHSRTYRLPWIRRLYAEPELDINPADSAALGLEAGGRARLETPQGSIEVQVNPTEMVPQGVVSIYHGHPAGDVNDLFDPSYRDPISGFPGFKSALCRVLKT